MKYWFFIVGCVLSGSAFCDGGPRPQRGNLMPISEDRASSVMTQILETETRERLSVFKEAKFFLINGETELARKALFPLQKRSQGKYAPLLERYLAMAEFQDGNWHKALTHLDSPTLSDPRHFRRICPLKTILLVATQNTTEVQRVWDKCKRDNSLEFFKQDLLWLEALVHLSTPKDEEQKEKLVVKYNILTLANDDLKKILKLALYMGLDNRLLGQIDLLDYSVIQDEELRGLLAHINYRQGRLAMAWRLMEDLSSTNVENMKGNIWLLRGKDELAYAQFKLALQSKVNSKNALERALPLAWSLKQWQEGMKLSERLDTTTEFKAQTYSTMAAFDVAGDRFSTAAQRLLKARDVSGKAVPFEVARLQTYVALRTGDARELEQFAMLSCEGGDTSACWMLTAQTIWEDLPRLAKRDGPLLTKELAYKEFSRAPAEVFKEEVFVDQRDIDELDEADSVRPP